MIWVLVCFNNMVPPLSLKFRCFSDSECRAVEGFLESVLGLTRTEAAAAVSSFAVVVGAICCAAVAICAVSNEMEKNMQDSVLALPLPHDVWMPN